MIKKKKTIFNKNILLELPLTYYLMDESKTEEINELYLNTKFSNSKLHFSRNYLFYTSYKPISNFIIKKYVEKKN